MNHFRLFFWSLTAALAGFLFGFDTVVISGAEQKIQALWSLGDGAHGLAMSMALWGTVVGSLIGGFPTERFGRKKTLLSIGILYFVSAVGSAYAPEVYSFMFARFIGGLGVGISTVAAPLYIAEIAPAHLRGRLAGLFQFNIVFGILVAFLSNSLLSGIGENAWRWMMGVEAFPALLYSVLCFGIPESPRWLIVHGGDRTAGLNVFRRISPEMTNEELEAKADEVIASRGEAKTAGKFWTSRLKVPIMLAFLIAFFNQLSGINAILYFAPRIFELTGLGAKAALLQSVGIGVTNLVFTFVGLWLIDRLGRKTLLYIGSFGYIISLGLCAAAFLFYAPQFKVATTSMTVMRSIEKMDKAQQSEFYTVEDRAALGQDYEAAKMALVEASSNEAYLGEAVVVPADVTPASMTETAAAALSAAAEFTGAGSKIVLLCIFAFIAAHAIGQGAVIWVFIGEIFPNRNRASGQALGSFTHWIFAAMLTLFFPIAISRVSPGYVFGFFCFMMCLQLVWVKLMVIETKGISLEEIQEELGIPEAT
ncbi:MAG: sugar porter family MFS transporter [Phycisphaeraceae bacterium]|nr:sugar porter family MFS transporter [Phycisphaeraceae bacterium]